MTLANQKADSINAKTILSAIKEGADTWFGLRYNMNLYRGCQHGCIYCDSRSACYRMDALDHIYVKENALALLEKELASKRNKGTIGFGSMNDPYMPLESNYELTRGALKLIWDFRFPIHIITKSDLVVRDIDLIKKISRIYAAVSFTITTFDDELSSILEPYAPVTSKRFQAMKALSDAGIYTGLTLMPILPYINDSPDNIRNILVAAKANGAQYVVGSMGLTLREGSRDYYYKQLDVHFPGLKARYESEYKLNYNVMPKHHKALYKVFYETCKALDLPTKMTFYKASDPSDSYEQMTFDLNL